MTVTANIAVRMPHSRGGTLHLDNGRGYPACAGRYGNTPGISVPGGVIDCRKCVQIVADMTPTGGTDMRDSTGGQEVIRDGAVNISVTTSVADRPSAYTVTFQHAGQALFVKDITANSPQEAVAKAYAQLDKLVSQQQVWMVD